MCRVTDTNSPIVYVQVVIPHLTCIEKMDHFLHQTQYPTLQQNPKRNWTSYTQYLLHLIVTLYVVH